MCVDYKLEVNISYMFPSVNNKLIFKCLQLNCLAANRIYAKTALLSMNHFVLKRYFYFLSFSKASFFYLLDYVAFDGFLKSSDRRKIQKYCRKFNRSSALTINLTTYKRKLVKKQSIFLLAPSIYLFSMS